MTIKNKNKDAAPEPTWDEVDYQVGLPAKEVYRSLVEHFSREPDVKISKKKEPFEITLQIGSLMSGELGKEKGSVRIRIEEVKGESHVRVKFSFVTPYLVSTVYWIFIWSVLIFVGSLVFPQIWQLALTYYNVLLCLTMILVLYGVGYFVGMTKERFTTQLYHFFQTIESRRHREGEG